MHTSVWWVVVVMSVCVMMTAASGRYADVADTEEEEATMLRAWATSEYEGAERDARMMRAMSEARRGDDTDDERDRDHDEEEDHRRTRERDADADAPHADVVDAVVADHARIKQLADVYFNSSGAAKATAARRVINALFLHDRRERLVLHPLMARVAAKETHMERVHNEMVITLIHLSDANLANASVQKQLTAVTQRFIAHNNHEEQCKDALPALRAFLKTEPASFNTRLAVVWRRITRTTAPLVPELVAAQHATIYALIGGYMTARQTQSGTLEQQTAERLVAVLSAHMRCERTVFYPVATRVLRVGISGAVVSTLLHDHERMTEMIAAVKARETTEDVSESRARVNKLLSLKLKHMLRENVLVRLLVAPMLRRPDINTPAVLQYLECEMQYEA